MHDLVFAEVLRTNHVDVSVKDTGCDEQGFFLVIFFLMEVEDFLDSIGA